MSDETLNADKGGAADDGGGAGGDEGARAGAASEDVILEDGEDDGEATIFSELAAERGAGKRFDAMAGGAAGDDGQSAGGSGQAAGAGAGAGGGQQTAVVGKDDPDHAAALRGGGAAGGAGSDGAGAAGQGDAGAGADAATGGAGDSAAGGAGAVDLAAFTERALALRDKYVKELGEIVVEPAVDGEEAVNVRGFAEDYRSVVGLTAVFQTKTLQEVDARYGPMLDWFKAQQQESSRERLLGDLEAEIPGARTLADSPDFSTWYGKQTTAVRALGVSPDKADAGKLLKLYLVDNPKAGQGTGARGTGGGEDAARRARRLSVLAAGSGGGGGGGTGGARGGNPIERAGVAEFADEEDVEAEFDRLVKERRAKAAK